MGLSLSQAARRLGISKSSVWRAVRDGRLKASKAANGRFQIDEGALVAAFPKKSVLSAHATVLRAGVAERLAVLEQQVFDLKAQLADLRQERDDWKKLAQQLGVENCALMRWRSARVWGPYPGKPTVDRVDTSSLPVTCCTIKDVPLDEGVDIPELGQVASVSECPICRSPTAEPGRGTTSAQVIPGRRLRDRLVFPAHRTQTN